MNYPVNIDEVEYILCTPNPLNTIRTLIFYRPFPCVFEVADVQFEPKFRAENHEAQPIFLAEIPDEDEGPALRSFFLILKDAEDLNAVEQNIEVVMSGCIQTYMGEHHLGPFFRWERIANSSDRSLALKGFTDLIN